MKIKMKNVAKTSKLTMLLSSVLLVGIALLLRTGKVRADHITNNGQVIDFYKEPCDYYLRFNNSAHAYCYDEDGDTEIAALDWNGLAWVVNGYKGDGLFNSADAWNKAKKEFAGWVCQHEGGSTTKTNEKYIELYWIPNSFSNKSLMKLEGCFFSKKQIQDAQFYDGCQGACELTASDYHIERPVSPRDKFVRVFRVDNIDWAKVADGQCSAEVSLKWGEAFSNVKTQCIDSQAAFSGRDLCETQLGGIWISDALSYSEIVAPLDSSYLKSALSDNNYSEHTLVMGRQVASPNNTIQPYIGCITRPDINDPRCHGFCNPAGGNKKIVYRDGSRDKTYMMPMGLQLSEAWFEVSDRGTCSSGTCFKLGAFTSDQALCEKAFGGIWDQQNIPPEKKNNYILAQNRITGNFVTTNCYVSTECDLVDNMVCVSKENARRYGLTEYTSLSCPNNNAEVCVEKTDCEKKPLHVECVTSANLSGRKPLNDFFTCSETNGQFRHCVDLVSHKKGCEEYGGYCASPGEFVGALAKEAGVNSAGVPIEYTCDPGKTCITKDGWCDAERKTLAECCEPAKNLGSSGLGQNLASAIFTHVAPANPYHSWASFSERTYDQFFSLCLGDKTKPTTYQCNGYKLKYDECMGKPKPSTPPGDSTAGQSNEAQLVNCCYDNYGISELDADSKRKTVEEYLDECGDKVFSEFISKCGSGVSFFDATDNTYIADCAEKNNIKCFNEYFSHLKKSTYDVDYSVDLGKPLTTANLNALDPLGNGDGSIKPGADPASIVSRAVNRFVFPIAGIILFAMVVWGGVEIVTASAGGQQNKIDMGKKRITAAVIGFVILFCAYWLIQLVEVILGLGISA